MELSCADVVYYMDGLGFFIFVAICVVGIIMFMLYKRMQKEIDDFHEHLYEVEDLIYRMSFEGDKD